MYYVYIIQSQIDSSYYYGSTDRDVAVRLDDHNSGKSPHTNKLKPWKLIWYAGFSTKKSAISFEKYLKSGSGYAFSRKRLISK